MGAVEGEVVPVACALSSGKQTLVTLVHPRKGETCAELGAGFAVSTSTAWRHVNATIDASAARSPKPATALRRARRDIPPTFFLSSSPHCSWVAILWNRGDIEIDGHAVLRRCSWSTGLSRSAVECHTARHRATRPFHRRRARQPCTDYRRPEGTGCGDPRGTSDRPTGRCGGRDGAAWLALPPEVWWSLQGRLASVAWARCGGLLGGVWAGLLWSGFD
ncbi:helix-turn-helix domain-containing protein [Actinomadura rubrisoli]|uniref:helix-turn-helix domain-containing protein n=1 Tax=Actinomadura rubrisoli TaxID=2530368 RepID=UPI001404373A